jgi:radical SAM protein with 4Fe4S-binding SPASM domain
LGPLYYQKPLKNNTLGLSTKEIFKVLDTLKENGCIFLKFTGGEPLIRKDFNEIYSYAYDRNFKISIASNGSLFNKNILKLLSVKKPECIYISLYGSTNRTYYKFTNSNTSWKKIRSNIENLINLDIKINLKTVVNKLNRYDISNMKKFTDKYNIPFHIYTNVISCVDGNTNPKKLNVSDSLKLKYLKTMDLNKPSNKNYTNCSAGLTSVFINPEGKMFLCANANEKTLSLLDNDFNSQWNEILKLRKNYILKETPCTNCKYGKISGLCYPMFLNEYNASDKKLKSKCDLCYKLNEKTKI